MMFHPKHVLIKYEFQKHRMDHQSDILFNTNFRANLVETIVVENVAKKLSHETTIIDKTVRKVSTFDVFFAFLSLNVM